MAAITGTAAGHPSIRATHRKTLELTRDAEITARASCVVGVAVALDEHALAALQGRVALSLTAGDESATVRGRLNPAFQPGDPLVIRRAPEVTRNALVIDSDTTAADLPRSFVAKLAAAGVRIALRVEELDEPAPGVLVAGPGTPHDAVAAAHAAGDTVLPAPGLALADALRAVAGAAEVELVENVPAERVPKLLRRAGAIRAAIALDHGTPREQYVHWHAGAPLEIPGARGRTATLALVQEDRTPDTRSVSRPEPRTSR